MMMMILQLTQFLLLFVGLTYSADTMEYVIAKGNPEKIEGMCTRMFNSLDTDRNGYVTKREYDYAAARANRKMGLFVFVDKNNDGELTPYEFCDYFRSKMSTLTTEDFAKAKDDIAQFRQQGRTYFNMAYQQSCNEQDGDAFGKFEKCASAECTEEELKLKCATRKLKPAPVLQQTENKTIAFPEAPVATEAAAPTAPVEGSSSSSSNTTTSDVQPLDFGAIIKQQIRELQANLAIEIILFVGLLVLTVFSFMFLSWWYSMLAVITLLILMILVVVDSLRLALTRKAMSAFG